MLAKTTLAPKQAVPDTANFITTKQTNLAAPRQGAAHFVVRSYAGAVYRDRALSSEEFKQLKRTIREGFGPVALDPPS